MRKILKGSMVFVLVVTMLFSCLAMTAFAEESTPKTIKFTGAIQYKTVDENGEVQTQNTCPEIPLIVKNNKGERIEESKTKTDEDGNFVSAFTGDEGFYYLCIDSEDYVFDKTDVLYSSEINGMENFGTDGTESIFKNSIGVYPLIPYNVTLTGTKELVGKDLEDDMFTFNVYEGEDVVATGKNKADGTVVFSPISYTTSGTHTYTVKEEEANLEDVTCDTTSFEVVVEVKYNDNGTFTVTQKQDKDITFKNVYEEKTTTTATASTTGTTDAVITTSTTVKDATAPKTGETGDNGPAIIMLVIAAAVIGATTIFVYACRCYR